MTEKPTYSASTPSAQIDNTPQFIDLTSLQSALPPETAMMYSHTTAQGGVSGGRQGTKCPNNFSRETTTNFGSRLV